MNQHYSFSSKVWRYQEFGGWHFLNVPRAESQEIKELFSGVKRRGWGAVPVNVTIGATTWKTSIFPSKKEGVYLLALKKEVREKENINEDDTINVNMHILV
jgi:hypothetical protein